MGNPLFAMTKLNNMTQQMNRVMKEVQRIKNNPDQLGKLLYDNHRISEEQLSQLKQFNGDYAKMGQYLMQSGVISQQDFNQYINKK